MGLSVPFLQKTAEVLKMLFYHNAWLLEKYRGDINTG
jgi:hypothetical protein